MEEAPQAPVTPAGVRDGDPDALAALVARRGSAVFAYCAAVCDPDTAVLAAAEAFARFRAAVAGADDPGALDPETLLVGATRHSAAAMARTAAPDHGRRRGLLRGHGGDPLCPQIPALLAARASDMLGPLDAEALEQHLAEHVACREIEAAFRRAERAYRSPPRGELDAGVHDTIVAALIDAAPVAGGIAAGGAPEAPAEHGVDTFAEEVATADELDLDAHEMLAGHDEVAAEDEDIVAGEDDETAVHEIDLDERAPEPTAEEADTGDWESPAREWHVVAAVPVPADEREGAGLHGESVAAGAAAPVGLPRSRREFHLPHPQWLEHGPVYGVLLPVAAITVAIIIILAIAGVFGGDGPAPDVVAPALIQLG